VWERDQVSKLVTDLTTKFLSQWDPQDVAEEVRSYDPYFLGPFVTYEKDGKFFLADGQQRFVTLLLLLIHLRRLLLEREDDSTALYLTPLISSRQFGHTSFTVDAEIYRPLFDALFNNRPYGVDGEPRHVIRVWSAYGNIVDALPQVVREEALPLFVEWLTQRVSLVEIGAGDADQAWEVFQSMNDRGVHLTPMDHLKGYFIDDALADHLSLEDSWQQMVNSLEAIEHGSAFAFLKAVLRARFAPAISNSSPRTGPDLEKATHEWVRAHEKDIVPNKRHGDLATLIPGLFVPLSAIFRRLLRARNRLAKGLEAIYFNAQNGIIDQFDLTMACVHATDTDSSKTQKMQLVANFIDVLLVRHAANNRKYDQEALDVLVARLLPSMRAAQSVNDVKDVLAQSLADEDATLAEIEALRLRDNASMVHYILARMTAWIDAGSERGDLIGLYLGRKNEKRQFQIEHLLSKPRNAYGSSFDDEDEYQHWRSRLGALLLLDGPENAGFGAASLAEKINWYPTQNLLAASLSPAIKKRGFARFRKFAREQELHKLFIPYEEGIPIKRLIEQRSRLYREIAERIWSPQRLGLIATTPTLAVTGKPGRRRARRSYGVNMGDLLRAGFVAVDDILVGLHRSRPYRATILADGRIRTPSGGAFDTPSAAAMDTLNRDSWNGWNFWKLERTSEGLDVLRLKFLASNPPPNTESHP